MLSASPVSLGSKLLKPGRFGGVPSGSQWSGAWADSAVWRATPEPRSSAPEEVIVPGRQVLQKHPLSSLPLLYFSFSWPRLLSFVSLSSSVFISPYLSHYSNTWEPRCHTCSARGFTCGRATGDEEKQRHKAGEAGARCDTALRWRHTFLIHI